MSNTGEAVLPNDFDENPEWTDGDFANARVGAPWLWQASSCAKLREALAALEPSEAVTPTGAKEAVAKIHEALQELEQPA